MQVNVFFHSHTMEKHVLVQHVVTWIMPVKELGVLRKLMPTAIILMEIMVIVKGQYVEVSFPFFKENIFISN